MNNRIKNYLMVLYNQYRVHKILKDKKYKYNRYAANLIRYTHSIEKGLSIANPRSGFGKEKINQIIDNINLLSDSVNLFHNEAINMALAALHDYSELMKSRNYEDNVVIKVNEFLKCKNYNVLKGGTITVKKKDIQFSPQIIKKFIETRHSIRDFDNTEIDQKKLKKALQLAQHSPSACNRQGYRVYVVNNKKIDCLHSWLDGVGGFQKNVKAYIMITGKITSYFQSEINQYIVSASMYAAYLTLTLHLYGMGSCVIQRSVLWTKSYDKIREKMNIPGDEQLICILAVGNLKNEFVVPISNRINYDEIVKYIK